MKALGITLLVFCIIGGAISVLCIFTGNQYESANGVVVFGSAIGGIVMSCVLIALAEIIDILYRIESGARERSQYKPF